MIRKANGGAIPPLITMKSDKISPVDYHMVPVNPDIDFDPKHNQDVIDYTIRKAEELKRKKDREFTDKIRERTEAMSTYFESLKMGNTSSDYKRYFGTEHLAHLKGQELLEKLKTAKQINPNGSLMKRVEKFYASKTKQG